MSAASWFRLLGSLTLVLLLLFAGPALPQTAKGKKYALLVGVKKYKHDSLPNLAHTENDAEELATLLKGKDAGFDEVLILTSTRGESSDRARPTAANIRAELKRLLKKVDKDDLVLIGLAGHGLQITLTDPRDAKREKEESFFCPADARPTRSKDLKDHQETMIPLFELFHELEDSGAGVKLLLADCCRNEPKLGRNVDVDNMPRPPRGTAALFSCKSGERAFEKNDLAGKGKGHGIFFHHVIKGMQGAARNNRGEVTWNSLSDYVCTEVSEAVPKLIGGGAKQTPHEIKNLTGRPPVLLGASKELVVEPRKGEKDGAVIKKAASKFLDEKFTGWQGLKGMWTFDKGVLTGTSPKNLAFNTFLYSKKEYGDFEMTFEVRLKDGKGNTGVQIRSKILDAGKAVVGGPQVDMGQAFWGSLYGERFAKGMMRAAPKATQDAVKPTEFNKFYIRCVGKKVTIKVNGTTTVDEEFPNMEAKGIIAFQIHGGTPMEVQFKDIVFAEL